MGKEIELKTRTIVGPPDEVESAIRAAHRQGLIPEIPRNLPRVPMDGGRIAVKVQMVAPAPKRTEQGVSGAILSALGFVAGLTMLALLALGAVGYALYRVLAHGNLNAEAVGGFLAVVALVLFALTRVNHSGACPGIAVHCKGCKH